MEEVENAMGVAGGVEAWDQTAEERLVYQGEVFINFRNHTYQWSASSCSRCRPAPTTMRCWHC